MNTIKMRLRSLMLAISAAALLVVVAAAPASASIVNAKFSSGTIKLTTAGVTVKKGGIDPKACSLINGATSGTTSEGSAKFSNGTSPLVGAQATVFSCPSSTFLDWDTAIGSIKARYDTVTEKYYLEFWPEFTPVWRNPWGTHQDYSIYKGTFTNGSGLTPSKLVLSEAIIGIMWGESSKLTLSGTFDVTTKEGGLLTLSH